MGTGSSLDSAPDGFSARRQLHLLLLTILFLLTLGVLAFALGAVVYTSRSDAARARRESLALLRRTVLPAERLVAVLPAFQRHWWDYFAPTYGVLAVTDARLVFAGVPPTGWGVADRVPLSVALSSYAYDTLGRIALSRVYAGTARGVVVHLPHGAQRFGIGRSSGVSPLSGSVQYAERRRTAVQEMLRCDAERRAVLAAPPPLTPRVHAVERGEALSTIAAAYGTTTDELRRLNDLPDDAIRAGQSLVVGQMVDTAALARMLPRCSGSDVTGPAAPAPDSQPAPGESHPAP